MPAFNTTVVSEYVPPDFQWPTDADYTQKLVQAVGTTADYIDTGSYEQGGFLNPPIIQEVLGLKTSLESITGVELGELVSLAVNISSLVEAVSAAEVYTAVSDIVMNGAEIAAGIADAAGAAASAVNMIPLVGQLVSGVLSLAGAVEAGNQAINQAAADCQKAAEQNRNNYCELRRQQAIPVATGTTVLPADLFRPLAYSAQLGAPLPFNASAMYAAVCGGETRGVGPFSRPRWNQIRNTYRSQTGNKHIGVPMEMQRKMWALIEAIMASAEKPGIKAKPEAVGDSGRAAMPVLQDMVRNLWQAGLAGDRGYGIDRGFLLALQQEVLHVGHYFYHECPAPSTSSAGQKPAGGASCIGRISLVAPFEQTILGYQYALWQQFLRPDGSWKVGAAPPPGRTPGLLTLSPAALKSVINANARLMAAAEGKKKQSGALRAIGIVAASAAAAGAGWWAVNRYSRHLPRL